MTGSAIKVTDRRQIVEQALADFDFLTDRCAGALFLHRRDIGFVPAAHQQETVSVQAPNSLDDAYCCLIVRQTDDYEIGLPGVSQFQHGLVCGVASDSVHALLREWLQIDRTQIDQTDIVSDGFEVGRDPKSNRSRSNDYG